MVAKSLKLKKCCDYSVSSLKVNNRLAKRKMYHELKGINLWYKISPYLNIMKCNKYSLVIILFINEFFRNKMWIGKLTGCSTCSGSIFLNSLPHPLSIPKHSYPTQHNHSTAGCQQLLQKNKLVLLFLWKGLFSLKECLFYKFLTKPNYYTSIFKI